MLTGKRAVCLITCAILLALPGAAGAQADGEEARDFLTRVDQQFDKWVVTPIGNVLYYSVFASEDNPGIPVIIIVLVSGGIFFTLRYNFINIRLFRHAIDVVRGRYDNPEDEGEISHFKALTSALSATVGLGNIAGVAIAISFGGPGAVFWMWVTAIFGMSMKFSSCTLAQLHRIVHPDGRVLGGPMIFLSQGLPQVRPWLRPLGQVFAVLFAVLTILAAFGAGNMFQANQTATIIQAQFFATAAYPLLVNFFIGLLLAFLVGIVIIGGIRRIGETTSRLVPGMCLFYCGVCLLIISLNLNLVPSLLADIFRSAFAPEPIYGGFIGVLVQGMRRAAFSNEAGTGSAAIAHAAAKTKEPVREGLVAMLGPFIDTICVCTMTALAILITGAHKAEGEPEGIQITLQAFSEVGALAPVLLCAAVVVFAFSTMISWGYYGERATEYLAGTRAVMPYRVIFVLFVVLGPILKLQSVLDFGDIVLLSMAFPNIIGMIFLSAKVKQLTDDYVRRLKSGDIRPVSEMERHSAHRDHPIDH